MSGPAKQAKNFYPRPPRGGRRRSAAHEKGRGKISIHALREEGDHSGRHGTGLQAISIHALREEGDSVIRRLPVSAATFLSTPSARRATTLGEGTNHVETISIHALREEGDAKRSVFQQITISFLSTPSARRAT